MAIVFSLTNVSFASADSNSLPDCCKKKEACCTDGAACCQIEKSKKTSDCCDQNASCCEEGATCCANKKGAKITKRQNKKEYSKSAVNQSEIK